MTKSKTAGEICDQIAKSVTKFYVETLKSGPRESRCYLIEDMIIIRLRGKLMPVEEQILTIMQSEKGVELVKKIRKILHQATDKKLSQIVEDITRCKVVSAHSDISTRTGERMEIFILDSNLGKKLEKKDAA
jgi:uncharacterized protein YbcI